MQFDMRTEYGVGDPDEIRDSLIIKNYRATEMVVMNSRLFPKADLEYCDGHYEFLCMQLAERGLNKIIDRLDMADLRSDERSERMAHP